MADPRALADEAAVSDGMAMPDLIAFRLRRAGATVLQDLQAGLAEANIRPVQFAILTMLAANPGVRQSQLSPALGIRRTNLVPLLSELETRGLCERRPVAGDRRAAALFLTQAGMDAREQCQREAAAHETRLCGRLGADGRQQLMSLLQRLTDPASDPAARVGS